ncbi:MAG: hypothetical protein M0R20_00075 [Candidatus Omnitrophica bacterium]|jgi:uncharacterized protein YfbU (UPF0304 family)|nr:hypothetical protein [Candidatus Omnitrophota bacterium]
METNISKYKIDLEKLIDKGYLLYYSMAIELNIGDPKEKKELKKIADEKNLPSFKLEYETWYSEAQQVIKQIIPDRLNDFIKLYKEEKRKEISFLTYTISDCMLGLRTSRLGETIADGTAAFPKFEQQLNILKSAQQRFASSLFDIKQVLQADIFDNELAAAQELIKKGFVRGAGAIAGVILEKHLAQVCENHKIGIKNKNFSLSEYNDALKNLEVIDIPQWRFIQHLTDLRNVCDHKKQNDPKKDEIEGLISGVEKIIKTIF